ncbi:MAG: hypothetical protein NXI08_05155 [bacterium]|nr:hypothetical protein [bacterium]
MLKRNSTILLLLLTGIVLIHCSKENNDKIVIDTDLTMYGYDSLEAKTLSYEQLDSVSNLVHENIKEDYLSFKNQNIESEVYKNRTEEYYADKLYGYYLQFTESEERLENLKRAFSIWYVFEAFPKMEIALENISIDEDYWGELVNLYSLPRKKSSILGFINKQQREKEIQQLIEWNNIAKNEISRTHLSFYIARSYFFHKEYEKADIYLRTVLEINRDTVLKGCEKNS